VGAEVQQSAATRDRLWTPSFTCALAVNFAVMMVFYLLLTTLAVYAIRSYGVSDSIAGLTASMFVIGAVISRLSAGSIIAWLGMRRVLLVATVGLVVGALLYFTDLGLIPLLGLRLLHGLTFGLASTAVNATVQLILPNIRRGEGTSYFALSWPLAAAIGPALAFYCIDRWGYDALFLVGVIVSVLSLIFALGVASPPPAPPQPRRAWWRQLIEPRIVPFGLLIFFLSLTHASVLTFMHPFAEATLDYSAASQYFIAYALAALAGRLIMGRIQDRWGDNVVMIPSLLLFSAGLFLVSVADTHGIFIISGALIGTGYGTVITCGQALVTPVVGTERTAGGMATFFLFLDSGSGLGPVVLGLLLSATGFHQMYFIVAVATLASVGLYWLLHGRRPIARRRAVA